MRTILFCGGGSAGHVIPNIALIEDLKSGYNCVYMGTDGIESSICEQNGVKFYVCNTPKLVRGKILKNLTLPFKLFSAKRRAAELIKEIKPDLIFSKGGYASVPAVLCAKKLNIPVITHESDLNPGVATKFIAGRCKKVLTSFPSTARKFENGIYTGSPMRNNLFIKSRAGAREKLGLDLRPTVLVLGGGSGSKTINENLRKIANKLCKDYNVLHVCGKGNAVEENIYGYKQIEFAADMGEIYACADIAVSRCGSNTAFELVALKIPTVFIPLQNRASRGDQVENAEYFKNAGLCEILYERDLTPDSLYKSICDLFKNGKIKAALDVSDIKRGNEKIKTEVERTIRRQF